jgi:hypothetical protein
MNDVPKSTSKQPAFQMLFERLEKEININRNLIQACQLKSSSLCGPMSPDLDEHINKRDISNAQSTVIEVLNGYCDFIERNNHFLEQVLSELNNAL